MSALLTAELAGRRFGDRWVFRRVSFELLPGQCLAVTGRNGQGKSTLLKLSAGLLEPTEGSITATGRVGYSALDLSLYPFLTAAEHIEWCADLAGVSVDPKALLTEAGIGDAADRPAQALSTGMRSRLKLILAQIPPADVLILDEPTAALDEDGRALLASVVSSHLTSGKAVLMATNDRSDLALATHELPLA